MQSKYLELLLDLLEVEDAQTYLDLAKEIERGIETQNFLFAHRGGFILQGYVDLLKGKIAPEEFVLLGDIESSIPLWQDGQRKSEELIESLLAGEIPSQESIIIDQSAWEVLLDEEQKTEVSSLLSQNKKTLILK